MTTEAAAPAAPRRSDAGQVRLTDRDITGLLMLAEHYAAPYDLLSAAMSAPAARTRAIVARWRTAGLAASGSFGPGPVWCWLTPAGVAATGRRLPAGPSHPGPPALARLAHIRAVLAARLWLQESPVYAKAQPWWHSERRIRAAPPTRAGPPRGAGAGSETRTPPQPPRPPPPGSWPSFSRPRPGMPRSSTSRPRPPAT